MLNENEVVDRVKAHLEENGWTVESRTTEEQGIDIKADKAGRSLCVEAKGATSSKSWTNRFGHEFTNSQVMDHVAKAFYVAAKERKHLSSIAVPRNSNHEHCMKKIRHALEKLKIAVFWVSEDGAVTTWNWAETAAK